VKSTLQQGNRKGRKHKAAARRAATDCKGRRQKPVHPRPPSPAFTLIELLVVISIITILAGMLLPVLGHSKQSAQGVQCLSNLRQMHLGWQLYTSDHSENYPYNPSMGTFHMIVGEDYTTPSWVAGIMKMTATPDNTNTDKLIGSAYARFGSIGGYIAYSDGFRTAIRF
jgi:prepilin-type N-terminal cleavage/methylation domain-containing protein